MERELWARAGGRCQFRGCNQILYRSPVTNEPVHHAEKAHIYSFSEKGPRGWGLYRKNRSGINDIDNLMLVCQSCHVEIDELPDGGRYSAQLLKQWKHEHESRVAIVTGISPNRKSQVIHYCQNVGNTRTTIDRHQSAEALFPDWYPATELPLTLDMTWEGKDNSDEYWITEHDNLLQVFNQKIAPMLNGHHHFSVFGFATIPLLIRLGTLFTDKVQVETYQLHREPTPNWRWEDHPSEFSFPINKPDHTNGAPTLALSLSANISHDRIHRVCPNTCIWELTIENPHNDFLRSRAQRSAFRTRARRILADIAAAHGNDVPISIFPAIPVAAAIEFGRIRMEKADNPWIIYDQNNTRQTFVKAIEIKDLRS